MLCKLQTIKIKCLLLLSETVIKNLNKMKKNSLFCMAAMMLLFTGCTTTGTSNGSTGLGGILNGIGINTVGDVLASVLGINKVSQETLVGNWKYYGPGCAFTSDNALAKAGGEVAAAKIKSELQAQYQKFGISSSNTYFNFGQDNTFSGKVAGKNVSGQYTFDPNSGQIVLKTLLFSLTGYVTANTQGISLLFESEKLLSIFQTVAAVSGNTTLSTIGEISKNYDGVRLGFDMTR